MKIVFTVLLLFSYAALGVGEQMKLLSDGSKIQVARYEALRRNFMNLGLSGNPYFLVALDELGKKLQDPNHRISKTSSLILRMNGLLTIDEQIPQAIRDLQQEGILKPATSTDSSEQCSANLKNK